MSEKRGPRASDALLAAGTGAVVAPDAVNYGHGKLVRLQMKRAIGNKGGLDQAGRPVNPFEMSGARGTHASGRGASPSAKAAHRYQEAAKPFLERLAHKPAGMRARAVGGTAGLAMLAASVPVGVAERRRQPTPEASVSKSDYEISPQSGFGIPPTRQNPLSPLALYASGNIMIGAHQAAQGKRDWPTPARRRARRAAYQFAGGLGMLYSPLGAGQRVTG